MIDDETKRILFSIYGFNLQSNEVEECYICKIFKENLGKAINSHSISKGHNLEGKKWLNLQHDGKNDKNKIQFTDYKTLREIVPKQASTSLSICDQHDKRFNIFETESIVDYNNIEHLNLLRLRTMIYFDYTYKKELKLIINKKENLESKKSFFIEMQNTAIYKTCLENLNNRISKKNTLINELKYLPYSIKNFWKNISKIFCLPEHFTISNEQIKKLIKVENLKENINLYSNSYNYEESFFLEQTEPILIIPLKKLNSIVGSFFVTQEEIIKFIKNDSLNNYKDLISLNYSFSLLHTENVISDNTFIIEDIESPNPIIFINIINNNNTPFVLFMGNHHINSLTFLFKIFNLFLNNKEEFENYFIKLIAGSDNVYYEEKFINNSLTFQEKQGLINFYNKEHTEDNKLRKIKELFEYQDSHNIYLKFGGFIYKNNSVIEIKPSIEILNFEVTKTPHNIYIDWNFRLGNGHSYTDKLGLLEHGDSYNEQYVLSVNRSSSQEFLSFEIQRIEVHIDSLEQYYEYEYDPLYDCQVLTPEQSLKMEKNSFFNSRFGEIYYNFLFGLPDFLNNYLKIKVKDITKVSTQEIDIEYFNKLKSFDFVNALKTYIKENNIEIGIKDFINKDLEINSNS